MLVGSQTLQTSAAPEPPHTTKSIEIICERSICDGITHQLNFTLTTVAIQQLLWDTALRVEDGNLSLAERELRQLQQALQEALARNAPDAEIEKLMNELQQAIDKYLQSMMENMQKMDPAQMEKMPPMDPSRWVTRDDLKKMLDRAR